MSENIEDLKCELHEKQETIDALLEEVEALKKGKKYFVSLAYHTGIVAGRTPETSGVFETKEQVNAWIDYFKKDSHITIENIVVVLGEQIPVVMEQKKVQSVAFKKEFIGI